MEEDIAHKIIGAAYNVFNTLGFGFLEDLTPMSFILGKVEER